MRRPEGNPAIASLQRSVFSQLAPRIAAHRGPVFRLHVGDTYLTPPPGARIEEQTHALEPSINRYASPKGRAGFIEAICARRSARDGGMVEPAQVLPTVGATGALSATVRALLAPGDHLMMLAPHWPLIRGMSVAHGLEVSSPPFYDRASDGPSARALLEAALRPETAAIYVNWPNNPSGLVPSREVVEAIVAFAPEHH